MENDELYQALFQSHPDDLVKIRRYVKWVKYRRLVNNYFYLNPHWVAPGIRKTYEFHWVGQR